MIPIVAVLLVLTGGSNSTIVKFAVSEFPPAILVLVRSFIAAVALSPFILKTTRVKLEKKTASLLVINALFTINWLSFAIGIQKTSVTMSQLIYVPTSLIVVVLSFLMFGEKFTKIQMLGLLTTIFGAVILAVGSINSKDITFGDPIGNLLITFGMFCWAIYLVLSKRISHYYSPLTIIFYNFIAAFVITAILVLLIHPIKNFNLSSIDRNGFLSIAYIGIISSATYFYLNQWFVKHTTAFIASIQVYPMVIVASALGIIFYGEKLTLNLILAALLIMSGVFLSTSFQYIKRRRYAKN